ncbi:MAG: tRNA (adenosine(37)-N6)-threonylcarbamoyltransferase complex transferase subunit TsaD [Flavobacteriia bacterium]|nr:tRNA (adenosine(37)-N6)-threonylcarbamoyltransferase complex transferase subunit TsaD [Flavobacteriia bacterium]
MTKRELILAIESSCDDTACAVLEGRKVLSNVVANQSVHAEYGGVVPELASRAHQAHIVPVVSKALKEAGIDKSELQAIAFTSGPGLMGSLLVGTSFAKSLSMALNIPLIDVHHMRAHVLAHLIDGEGMRNPEFPFLCLTVSGGHTQIVRVDSPLELTVLGETIDDAAGEAFDKTAKLLGLPYPGGPEVDRRAQVGNPEFLAFSKPQIEGYNFSFSGLKTSVLYTLQAKQKEDPQFVQKHMDDICASVQKTIIDILLKKLTLASRETNIKQIAIAGGVSANKGLRNALESVSHDEGWSLYLPPFEFTTDNAAMIGIAGYYQWKDGHRADLGISAKARVNL